MVSSCSLFSKGDAVPLYKPKTRRAKDLFSPYSPLSYKARAVLCKTVPFLEKKRLFAIQPIGKV